MPQPAGRKRRWQLAVVAMWGAVLAAMIPGSFPVEASGPPTVTAISPEAGSTLGGTTVTVIGTNFVPGATTVAFGSASGTSVSVTSSTQLTVVSPPGAPGVVSVVVTTSSGPSASSTASKFAYASPGAYTSLTPARICDTRTGTGTPCSGTKIAANGMLTVQVTGAGGVPTTGAGAVMLDVTAIAGAAAGSLLLEPAGVAPTTPATTINFASGQTIANLAQVPLGSAGAIQVFSSSSVAMDAAIDVEGYVGGAATGVSGLVTKATPARICDTRSKTNTPCTGKTLAAASSLAIQVTGQDGIPSSGVGSVVANLTAYAPSATTTLTAYTTGSSVPSVANVDAASGATISNRVIVPVSSSGQISVYNAAGSTNIALDVVGWTESGSTAAGSPAVFTTESATRICDTRSSSGFACAGQTLGSGAVLALPVAGSGGVPPASAALTAVALNVTVVTSTKAGALTVYADGSTRPSTTDVNFAASQVVSDNVAFLPLGASDGKVDIYNSTGSTNVTVDVIGYYTLATVPVAPAPALATRGNASASVSWAAAANNGSVLTGYTVTPYIGSTAQTPTTVSASLASTTITGLTNGTAYTFQVTATNGLGTGPAATTTAVTPATVPGVPTSVTATPGNAQATVSWTAPTSNGGSAITGYTVTPYVGASGQSPTTVGGSTTSTTVSGLTNGTAYTFQVVATNAVGNGLAATSNAATPAGPPAAPGSVTATAGNAQAAVSWTAPGSNGSAITGYTVTPYVGTTAGTPSNVSGSTTSTTSTGLVNGTSYTFQVTATNGVGKGPAGTSNAVIPTTVPSAPSNVGSSAGNAQASVNWTTPTSNGGTPITGYTITPYVGSTAQTPVAAGATATSATVTGLANGTTYTFQVSATNADGASLPGTSSPVEPTGPPYAPTNVTATAGYQQATVSWTAPNNGGSPVTAYTITPYVGSTPGTPVSVGSSTTSTTVSGLIDGTTYTFQVTATNALGTGAAGTSNAVTPAVSPPASPTNVTATAGANAATVTWAAPSNNGGSAITGYLVTAVVGGVSRNATSTGPSATTATLVGLQSGVSYTLQVAALNAIGTGSPAPSNAVTPTGSASTYASTVLGDGASSYYRLDDTGPLMADSAGGHHVTAGNVSRGAGGALPNDPDGAVVTNGNTTGTTTSSAGEPLGAAPRTVEGWIRTVDGGYQDLISWGTNTGTRSAFSLYMDSSSVGEVTFNDDHWFSTGGRWINDGNWHLLDISYDGNVTVTAYLDGQSLGSQTLAAPLNTQASGLDVGASVWCGCDQPRNTDPGLDEVAVYPTALNAAQIANHFAAGGDTRPTVPGSLSATAGANSATVTWTAATATAPSGQTAVAGYVVSAYKGSTAVDSTSTGGSATTATLTGLQNGVSYTFQVSALNSFGSGSAGVSNAVTPTGSTSTYASTVLGDGPSYYYRLDDGGPLLADSSGAGHNAQAGGGVTHGAGGALANDPNAAVVTNGNTTGTLPSSAGEPLGAAPRTVEGWIRTVDGGYQDLISWGTNTGTRSAFSLYMDSSAVGEVTFNDDHWFSTGGRWINDGNWHLLDVSYDGNVTVTAYLDGQSLGSQTLAAPLNTQASWLDVGASVWCGCDQPRNTNPGLDEVAVYPTALNAAQIANHFAAGGDTRPTAPGGVSATAGANSATVSWTASTATVPSGQTAVAGYVVSAYKGSTAVNSTSVGSSATSATLTGLQGGVGYTFSVYALNGFGNGPPANSAAVTPTGSTSTYASTVLGDGPSFYYRLDDNGPLLADSSGSSHHAPAGGGVTHGASGALANDPNAAVVTNGNTTGTLPSSAGEPLGAAPRTVEGWIRTVDGGYQDLISWGTNTGTRSAFSLYMDASAVGELTFNDDHWFSTGGRAINDGNWHLLDISYDGNVTVTAYLDGQSLGSQTLAAPLNTQASWLDLGASVWCGCDQPRNTNPGLDEVAVYPTALNAAQIANHFAAGGDTQPTVPGGVSATAGANSATVSWTASTATVPSGTTPIQGYIVTAYQGSVARNSEGLPASATGATLTGLQGGAGYTFSVAAYNYLGSSLPGTSASVVPNGSATTYASTVLNDGPSLYYRLDDSGSVAADSSGNARNGAYNGAATQAQSGALASDTDAAVGVNGGTAVSYSGTGLPSGNAAASLEAWFRTTQTNWQAVASYGADNTAQGFSLEVQSQTQLRFNGWNDDLTYQTPTITDGNWHHAVAVYDGAGHVSMYLDGAALGTQTLTQNLNVPASSFRVGSRPDGSMGFSGAVDEVAVYPAALSAAQVTAHFAASSDAPPVAPTNVAATAGANQASVTWSATTATVPAGETPVQGYLVTAYNAATPTVSVAAPSSATSATLDGLQGGVAYTIRVSGINAYGTGPTGASAAIVPTGAATTYASTIEGDAPAAYYRLDDVGSPIAADSSGNRDLALYNQDIGSSHGAGETPAGASGALANDSDKAASMVFGWDGFTGGDIADYSATNMPQGASARTWEGWFQTTTGGAVAALRGSTFRVRVSAQYQLQVVAPSATLTWTTPYPVIDGNWHMVDAVYDGVGSVTLYLDGVSLGSQTGAGAAASGTGLAISGDVNGQDQLLGAIDEVALYDAALTSTQVVSHFVASGNTRPSTPIVTVTAGANQASLSWSPSTAGVPQGATQVTTYLVTALAGTTARNAISTNATTTQVTITGLQGGMSYSFQVMAENEFGWGGAGTSASVTPSGASTTYASTIEGDGPSLYFRLDDAGSAVAADSSGNGNLGLYSQNRGSGAGETPGGASGALLNDPDTAASMVPGWDNFTGGDVAVANGINMPQGASGRTWEGWFKTTGAGTVAALQGSAFRVRVSAQYQLQVVAPGATLTWTVPYAVTDNTWHLVDAAYDGTGTVTVYVDGVSLGAQSGAGSASSGTGVGVAADINGTDQLLGAVDEVALYDSVLSGTQVATHYAASGNARNGVPGAPQNATAAGASQQATVTWTAPASNGGGALTGYTVTPYIGSTAQSPTTVGQSVTNTTITGLTNGTTYTFQVVATNSFGAGAPAMTNAVIPAMLPGSPGPVTATASDGRANITWHTPAAPGNIIASYTVTPYQGSTALTGQAVTITSTNAAGVLTATSIAGLTDGTAYTFQVAATNGTGTGQAATSLPVTPTASAPLTINPGHGYSNGSVPQNVVLGDLSGAGLPDIVTANGSNDSVSALMNQVHSGPAGGTFMQPAALSSMGSAATDVALGDFNGDGKLDAVYVNGSHTVSILFGNGDGTFGPAGTTLTLSNQGASLVAVGDVNGDGKADIVVVGGGDSFPNNDTIAVFLGNGDGTFQAPIQNASHDNQCLGCGFFATGLILADLNGDERPDIVFSNDNTSGGADSGGVSVLMNQGGGNFGPWQGVASLPGPRSGAPNNVLAVADLNGDGIPDIVALESPIGNSNTRGIAIILGLGGGNFASPVYIADPSLTTGSTTYGRGQALAIADMNGDGNPDIVTADDSSSSSSPGISVYLNPGGGSIDTPRFIPTPSFTPYGLALGDVNGDHEPDVVLENNSGTGPSSPANVMVLLNGTDFPPLGSALAAGEMHGCYMCQAVQGGGALRIDGTYPITVNSGEMSHTFTDVSVPARGYPLAVTQTYNDLAAGTDAGLGYGWWSPLLMSLTSDPTRGITSVTQEDGAVAQFWTSSLLPIAARTQATLTHNADGTWTFNRYNGTIFTFNATGQITSLADLTGDSLTYGYTGGQITSETHSDGRSLAIGWTGSHISSITDSNVPGTTRTVSLTYDGGNQLTDIDWRVNGSDDRNEHFTYESAPWNHGMTAMRDPRGITVSQVYDSAGHTTSQTIDPGGLNRTTSYAYTVSNGAITQALITDPAGHQELDSFNYGELTQKTLGYNTPQAATWRYTFDPATIGTTMTVDPNGNVSTANYDSFGNVLTSTDPLGRTTTDTYGGNGGADAAHNQPTTSTDPNGVTTTYSYDATHRTLTQTSTPLIGSSPAVSEVVQYQHTNVSHPGDVTAMVDADGKTWIYGYDAYGDRTSSADPLGDRSNSTYNADGWMLTAISPKGDLSVCSSPCSPAQYSTAYAYIDASGNPNFWGLPTTVTDPLGHASHMTYDADNNRIQSVDGDGNPTGYRYDNANELTVTTRADNTTTRTDYNPDGTLADQIDGNSNTLQSYTYNSLAQRVTVTVDPGASPHLNQTTTYTYDGLGNMTSKQDPAGNCSSSRGCTTYAYDAASQLTSIHYSDGATPNVTMQYDGDGQRVGMSDGTGRWTWQYDSLHRLTSVTEGSAGTVGYQYDLRGLVTQIAYPGSGHTVTQGYDDAGRMTSVQDWNGDGSTFKYDANSNLYESDLASGAALVDTSAFNNADQLTGINDTSNATSLFSAAYTRDGNGQVSADSSATTSQNAYAYTALNQVCYAGASAVTPCSTPPTGAEPFAYDPGGNLTGAGTTVQAYNTADQLTASGATTSQYDTRGNRTSTTAGGATTSYGYDQANRLCWAGSAASGGTCNGNVQTSDTLYCYNGDGVRMAIVTAGSCAAPTSEEQFTWDLTGSLPLLLVDGSTDYVYSPSGSPLEQINGSTTLWYHHDQLGSTRAITDSTGTLKATYTFDPYGNLASSSGSATNQPFRFQGEYRDAETGLYYLRARYYDPTTGQFLSRDPAVAATLSPYGYVRDNPLNEVDPSGRCGLWGSDTCWGDAGNWINQNIVQPASQALQEAAPVVSQVASAVATVASGVATVCAGAALVGAEVAALPCAIAGVTAVAAGAVTTVFDGYLASQNQLPGGWGTVTVDAAGTVSGGVGEWASGAFKTAFSVLGFGCSFLSFNAAGLASH